MQLTNGLTIYQKTFNKQKLHRMLFSLFNSFGIEKLNDLLDNLEGQKVPLKQDVEILIAIDRSSDEGYDEVVNEIKEVVKQYEDPHVTYNFITTPFNQGVGVMRNSIMYKGKGKWMRFCDDDDASAPLQRIIDNNIKKLESSGRDFEEQFMYMRDATLKYVYKTSYVNPVSIIFNRKKFIENNVVFCPYIQIEDKFWRKLIQETFPEQKPLYTFDLQFDNEKDCPNLPIYYVGDATQSSSDVPNKPLYFIQIFQFFMKNLKLYEINTSDQMFKNCINVQDDKVTNFRFLNRNSLLFFCLFDFLNSASKKQILFNFFNLKSLDEYSLNFYEYVLKTQKLLNEQQIKEFQELLIKKKEEEKKCAAYQDNSQCNKDKIFKIIGDLRNYLRKVQKLQKDDLTTIIDKIKFKRIFKQDIFLKSNPLNKNICTVFKIEEQTLKYKNDSIIINMFYNGDSFYMKTGNFIINQDILKQIKNDKDMEDENQKISEKEIIQFNKKK